MTHDTLSATFAALADPTRRAILARLASGDCLRWGSLPLRHEHAGHLEASPGARAGGRSLAVATRSAALHLEAAPLRDVADWTEHYRSRWEHRLDRRATISKNLTAKEKPHARKHRK
jgi:hypothetical protein